MKITQLRNATIVLELGGNRILVDPMLASKGAFPPIKLFGPRLRNPTVELPANTDAVLDTVTHCLITHCQKGHFDHLDRAGKRWLRERQVPVICTPHDADYLRQRGLQVAPLPEKHDVPSAFMGGSIRTVPCTHGSGFAGLFMEHGVGYFIELPGEPSIYLAGDTVLTPQILDFVSRFQPQVCLVPAGGARFDIGSDIIMGEDDVVALASAVKGTVVANHMEAIGHCMVTRSSLAVAAVRAGVREKIKIPTDGETLEFPIAAGLQAEQAPAAAMGTVRARSAAA